SAIFVGTSVPGIGNILLNSFVVVNSPKDNAGFLPGMSSAAFTLGAGVSFAVLPVFMVAGSPAGSDSVAGYTTAFLVAAIILGISVATSLFIPKVTAAEAEGAVV